MKKFISLTTIVIAFLSFNVAIAQEPTQMAQATTSSTQDFEHKVELSALVGYQLNGSINLVYGDMDFANNINYGLALAVNVGYGTFIETQYTFCQSAATVRYWGPGSAPEHPKFDMDVHYVQLGGLKEFMDGRVRPFGLLTLGASGFVPVDVNLESWWQFAINLGLGVKINLTDNIALRAQARLLMPMYLSGLGIFCGSGGCSSGAYATSNVIQGDFMGGLTFGF